MFPFWLIASAIFFVAEIFTTGFLIFWFGIGALAAFLVSFFTTNLCIQFIVFIVVSTILLIFTRPLINKFLPTKNLVPTNIYSIMDKEGIVMENINNIDYSGKVRVNGELWSAISDNNLEKGTKIKVIKVDGVKLKVEPIKSSSFIKWY